MGDQGDIEVSREIGVYRASPAGAPSGAEPTMTVTAYCGPMLPGQPDASRGHVQFLLSYTVEGGFPAFDTISMPRDSAVKMARDILNHYNEDSSTPEQ